MIDYTNIFEPILKNDGCLSHLFCGSLYSQCFDLKSPQSSSQCVDLLDVKPEFIPQVKHQNESLQIFLWRLPLSRFLAKTLMVISFLQRRCHPVTRCIKKIADQPCYIVIFYLGRTEHKYKKVYACVYHLLRSIAVVAVIDQLAKSQASKQNTKSISAAISSQQISGKNSNGDFFSAKKMYSVESVEIILIKFSGMSQ